MPRGGTRRSPAAAFWLCLAFVLGSSPGRLSAQANQDIAFADFQFNRSLPGAKSLAMGGAFVALADDASAAYSNPAGLTHLESSEAGVEFRRWSTLAGFPLEGRVSGAPTGIGIDTNPGISRSESRIPVETLGFASVVFRPRSLPKLAVIAYHHVLADYRAEIFSQGLFTSAGSPRRFGPYHATSFMRVTDDGVGVAASFGRCIELDSCMRLGVSLANYSIDLRSRTDVFSDAGPDGRGISDFTGRIIDYAQTRGSDSGLGVIGGLLLESKARRWSLGVTVRLPPTLTTTERVFGPRRSAEIGLPSEYAVGIAFRPSARLTGALQIDHVGYSRLRENNGFSVFRIPDGNELRVGAQWRFPKIGNAATGPQFAIAAGAWLDPAHNLQARSGPSNLDLFRAAYFPPETDTDLHLTGGLSLWTPRGVVALALDHSERTTTLSSSVVIYLR